jgi:hypothetical protein
MDHQVLIERAAAQVAVRMGGAHSVEVWFAVLAALSELGLDSEEKLSALTHAEVVRVVHFLDARSIPVGHQFVRKVARPSAPHHDPGLRVLQRHPERDEAPEVLPLGGSATLLGTRLFKTCSVFKTPAGRAA